MGSKFFQQAEKVLCRNRHSHESGTRSFSTVAKYWSAYINQQYPDYSDISIEAHDVPIMMMLMKIAKEGHAPMESTRIDIANYAAKLHEVLAHIQAEAEE